MEKENSTTELAVGGNVNVAPTPSSNNVGLNALNFFDEKQLVVAENFLKKIVSSEKGGIKNVQDGFAILMRAKDLQLPFSTCIEHIHVINGKTGVDIHILKALLSRAGVTWKCTKDYAPQYQYTDGTTIFNESQLPDYCVKCKTSKEASEKTNEEQLGVYILPQYIDMKGTMYNETQLNEKCTKVLNKTQAAKVLKEGGYPVMRVPAQPIDYITEYEFTRYKIIHGKEHELTSTSRFTYSEAIAAGFLDKDTYKKYLRIMIGHRAFTLGARDIAPEVVLGVMDTTELKIVTDSTLTNSDFVEVEEVN